MTKNTFYVTTPIYYVTAKPHLGSLYSTLLADVATRWNKLKGKKTFFLTGTDEHGQKIAQAAELVGKDPKTFVDSFIKSYKKTWHDYHIEYNHFIRTTDDYHVKAVQQWLQDLLKKGDIYKSHYQGWYCTHCETFLTDKEVEEQQKANIAIPLCPTCNRPTHQIEEESYFFKLSAYQDKLLQFYKENPNFIIPHERLNEVIRFVEGGLKDLSISRTTISWGIPFPGDSKHVTYVWADALNNYITAIGYNQKGREKEFSMLWPADLQVLGKDIVRFHAVYWPAFLMASGLPLPKELLVHGWILMDQKKMSKSLGNAVDPDELCIKYGADPVRYYLMRRMAVTQDSSFSLQDLEQCISSDLANDLGNLLNRMLILAFKHDFFTILPVQNAWSDNAWILHHEGQKTIEEYVKYMDGCLYHLALGHLWRYINQVNAFFHAQEPWKLHKQDKLLFEEIISAVCHSLHTIALLLWPIMPEKMEQLLSALGMHALGMPLDITGNCVEALLEDPWKRSYSLRATPLLFEKITPELIKLEEQAVQHAHKPTPENIITIDDVTKVELLVGTIESCTEIQGSDKLYKLMVNFGHKGTRQILSGVRMHFTADELIGKQGVFVYNLKPRKMMGLESHGMMLFAKNAENRLRMVTIQDAVPNGTQLQ